MHKIRDAIQSRYLDLIEENKGDPKKMWQVINKALDKATPTTEISSLDVERKQLQKKMIKLKHLIITLPL